MNKIIFTIIVLLAYLSGCSSSLQPIQADQDSPDKNGKEAKMFMIEHLSRATAVLLSNKSDEEEDYRVFCSAVWISPDKMITARHCAEAELENTELNEINELLGIPPDLTTLPGTIIHYSNYDERDLKFNKNDKTPSMAVVIAYDKENDLAVLQSVTNTEHDYANLATSDVWIGQNVHIIGHSIGLQYNYFDGVISSTERNMRRFFRRNDKDVMMLHITAAVAPGNSGGGAFDEDGNIVGICSFIALRASNANFFVRFDKVKSLLIAENLY